MKFTRILSVLLVLALLAVCPGPAFAGSDSKPFSIRWWMDAMEIWADSCNFGADWTYIDGVEDGAPIYSLCLVERDKLKVIQHYVVFGPDETEEGYASIGTLSEYDDDLANDLRFYNQLSFLLKYLVFSAFITTEHQYEDFRVAIDEAMDCILGILSGDSDREYEFNDLGIDLTVFRAADNEGNQGIVLSMIYNTDNASPSTFTNDHVSPQATPQTVFSGKIIVSPGYDCVCPFTVEAPINSNCYVYLKYICTPPHSVVDRRQTNTYAGIDGDIAVYVGAGRTAEIDVPIGVYKLYYATGTDFYNTDILFGDDTRCYSSDDLFNFYADDEYYQGHIVTLYTVANGNLDTEPISEDQFPKR